MEKIKLPDQVEAARKHLMLQELSPIYLDTNT